MLLGAQRRTLSGFSSTSVLPHTGYIYHSDIVQSLPPMSDPPTPLGRPRWDPHPDWETPPLGPSPPLGAPVSLGTPIQLGPPCGSIGTPPCPWDPFPSLGPPPHWDPPPFV